MTVLRPEGETLATRLDREAIPVGEAVRIASAIAEALETAHAQGDVHGDLKPSNIILTPSGHVKLMDFGVASGKDDPRADILSLGQILNEMLLGNHDVPELLEHVERKMLAERPEERYQLIHEVRTDLAHVAEAYMPTTENHRSMRFGWPAVALLVALAVAGVWWLVSSRGPASGEELTSVAILPLRNLSRDPLESDYLAEGISQAVITKLTQAGFRVTPWETAQRYGDRTESTQQVAGELNVDAVLLGTFQLVEDRILVTLSFVEAKSGLQSWADEFEEPYEDIFGLQRRIAVGAATSLKRNLTGQEEVVLTAPESRSVEAYDDYLQGAHILQNGTRGATEIALEYFERALEIDPDLANAYVGLGVVYNTRYMYGWGSGPTSLQKAESSFNTALELDPTAMPARRGLVLLNFFKGQTRAALEQGRLAARIGPADGVETLLTRALAFHFGGLPALSLDLYRRVIEIDPANPEAHYQLVLATEWSGDYESAIDVAHTYLERFGNDSDVLGHLAATYQLSGDVERARGFYVRATGGEPLPWVFLWSGLFFDQVGERDRAEELWARGARRIEANLVANPDHAGMRSYLGGFRGLLTGDSAFIDEAERAFEAAGYYGWELENLIAPKVKLGDGLGAIELLREQVRQGRLFSFWENTLKVASVTLPESEELRQFRTEYEALEQRYREQYANDSQSSF